MAELQSDVELGENSAQAIRLPTFRSVDPVTVRMGADRFSPEETGGCQVRHLRIGLFGMFGGGNYGNDGSLESMLLLLRRLRPEAQLSCICVDPESIAEQYRIPTTPLSAPAFTHVLLKLCDKISMRALGRLANWVRAILYVRNLDLIIVPGTSTLCDYRSGPLGTPYGLFRWAAAARLCGVRFCFVGTGAGPIWHDVSRWMLKNVAQWAHYRSFRDRVSKDFVTSLGVDTSKDPVHPDLVFRMPVPESRPAVTIVDRPLTVGVGVMNYNGWRPRSDSAIYDAYMAKMGYFVTSLLRRGYRIRLLTGETADRQAVEHLAQIAAGKGYHVTNHTPETAEPGQVISEPTLTLHDLMQQMLDTDAVVATRFHNIICSLKLARPTISIGYEAKNEAVMADFGIGHFSQHIDELDLDWLEARFAELTEHRKFWADSIRQRLQVTQLRMEEFEQGLEAAIL